MHLSDEQMRAVMHGLPKAFPDIWYPAILPEGRQPVPAWAKGLWIEWMDGYGNNPHYVLLASCNLREWESKRFKREGERFFAVSEDGRAECYYQGGPLVRDTLRRYLTEDGSYHAYAPSVDGKRAPGEWVAVSKWCTRQEQGFGGSHIDIVMEDGTDVTLRGPWSGGCPLGYVDVAYCDKSSDGFKSHQRYRAHYRRPEYNKTYWNKWGTATGGLYLSNDVFKLIFARFQPHLQLAWVNEGRGERLQAMKPEWTEPKPIMLARERIARMETRVAQ